ncbi:MAG: sialate O-acetylesterase [Jannaschia sp.]
MDRRSSTMRSWSGSSGTGASDRISGLPNPGETLTASSSIVSPKWYLDGVAVAGAAGTARTLSLAGVSVGAVVSVRDLADRVSKTVTAPVVVTPPPPTGTPVYGRQLLDTPVAEFLDVTNWSTLTGFNYNTTPPGTLVVNMASSPAPASGNVHVPFNSPVAAGEQVVVEINTTAWSAGTPNVGLSDGASQTLLGVGVNQARRRRASLTATSDIRTHLTMRAGGRLVADVANVGAWSIQDMIDAPKKIFVTAGQSNMDGPSSVSGFNAADFAPDPRALWHTQVTNSTWNSVSDGSGPTINAALNGNQGIGVPSLSGAMMQSAAGNPEGNGPMHSIIKNMMDDPSWQEDGYAASFIGSSEGGTSISPSPDGGWAFPGNTYYPGGNGRLYDMMVAHVAALRASVAGSEVAGFFWCQGESDASLNYAPMFKQMILGLRAIWGDFPVVILEIGGLLEQGGVVARINEQKKLDQNSGDVSAIPNCTYVTRRPDAVIESDAIHFDVPSQIARGEDAAAAMIALLNAA